MANVKLEWLQATYVESFNIYRSDSSMNTASMPAPLATGITNNYYFDTSITVDETYFYRVGAVRGEQELISGEIEVLAGAPVVNDPHWANVELLIYADAINFPSTTFIDSSSKNRAISASSSLQIVSPSVTEPHLDSGSIYFDGLSGQVLVSYAVVTRGKYDFTVECFIKIPVASSSNPLNAIVFNVGGMILDFNNNYTTASIRYYLPDFSISIARNVWTHICMMRSGDTVAVYVNGVLIASTSTQDSLVQNLFSIGEGSSANRSLNAYINSVRFTKSARYTVEGFTPPAEKFPNS